MIRQLGILHEPFLKFKLRYVVLFECQKKPPEFVSHVPNTSTVDELDADADVD
jgi:hypothetical protein